VTSLARRAFISPLLFIGVALVIASVILYRSDSLSSSFYIIAGVILVLAVPYFWIQSRQLVQPIANLIPHAAEVAKGRLEVSTSSSSGEIPQELQSLAEVINQIAEKQGHDYAAMQKLERVRSEFLANVSHELRTPIFAVQGFLETLLDGAVDDPAVNRDFLTRAQAQSERLNALLNDLIDISRIESGEMRMSFRFFDVGPFVRDIISEMQDMASYKQIELYYAGNVMPHHEVDVFGDKERLKQVLVNLIGNAIKYTETKGSVKVELINDTPKPQYVTVAIHDTGIGIPAEHLPRLFERFYRVDKDRSRSAPGGTGLGLAICKHIIEAHKSSIKVISSPGDGSTFSFVLHKEPFL
jgi:two-component system phosphate regulon sensor histidine kinase PhoR